MAKSGDGLGIVNTFAALAGTLTGYSAAAHLTALVAGWGLSAGLAPFVPLIVLPAVGFTLASLLSRYSGRVPRFLTTFSMFFGVGGAVNAVYQLNPYGISTLIDQKLAQIPALSR